MPAATNREPSRRKRAAFALAALILVLGSLAVLGEITLRVFYPGFGKLPRMMVVTERTDSRSYRLKPNMIVRFGGMRSRLPEPVTWQTNGAGVRGEQPVSAKSKRFRIVTMGDSETFGWSLQQSDTFQRRMEARDPTIEVINLGVPGYNIENVADYLEEALPQYRPDLVYYMFHKNDVDEPLVLSPVLGRSYVFVFLRLTWAELIDGVYDGRKQRRFSRVGRNYFQAHIRRMVKACRRVGVPIIVGFLDWRFADYLPPQLKSRAATRLSPNPGFQFVALNIEQYWKRMPRLDDHMTGAAHDKIASSLCRAISGAEGRNCSLPLPRPESP